MPVLITIENVTLGEGATCAQVATRVPERELSPALPAAGAQILELDQASLICMVPKVRPQAAPAFPRALSNLQPPSAPFTLHPVPERASMDGNSQQFWTPRESVAQLCQRFSKMVLVVMTFPCTVDTRQ